MISRKQLSKNLYKLTKKEFPEIFGEETNDDTPEVDSLGFPSIEEMVNYGKHGEDRANALDYEKAYIALIEQVKDKTHDEKVTFLMSHMDELRGMVELFSYTDDDIEIKDDELLANLMLYRYENKISIIDDHDLELTKDYISETMAEISCRRSAEQLEAKRKFRMEHPEEYEIQFEKEREAYEKTSMELIKSLKARAKRNEIDSGKIHGHLSCSKKEY